MANESSVLVRLRLLGGSQFAREARGAGTGLGSIGTMSQRVSTRLGGVNRALGVTALAMRTVAGGGALAVGAGLAYGVKQSVNFEQQMANVQARLLTTGSNMQQLTNLALQLGAKTQFSASQAAGGMDQLAAAGFTTQQIMETLPGTLSLAAASGTDLAFAAELQGAALRGFGLRAGAASHVADVLALTVNRSALEMTDLAETLPYVASTARVTGTSFEQVAAAAGILGNAGIKGSMAGTALRTSMLRLTDPTKKMKGVLASLGIGTRELAATPLPNVIARIAGELHRLPTRGQRVGAISALFGKEAAPSMLNLMSKGAPAIERMTAELENSRGAAQRSATIMRSTVRGAWDNFTGSVETASITLMTRFNPAIRGALNAAASGVNRATGTVGRFVSGLGGAVPRPRAVPGHMQEFAGGAGALTGAAAAGAKVRATLGGLVSWGLANLPRLGSALKGAGGDLVDAFAPAMPFVRNVLLPVLAGVAKGVLGGVVVAFRIAVPVVRLVASAFGFVGETLAPLRPVFGALGMVVGFLAGGPILDLLGGLRVLGPAFRLLGLPIRFASAALGLGARAATRLFGAFGRALTGVQRFVGTFTGLPARMTRAALNIVGGVVHTIETLPGRIGRLATRSGVGFVGGMVSGVRSKLAGLTGFMGRVGAAAVNGVVKGVKAAPSAIGSALLSLVPGPVKGAVRGLLGIPKLATGGRVIRGGAAVVGDRGPELVNLPTNSMVYDSRQTRRARTRMAAMAPITLVANLHLDGKQIHSAVFRVDRQLQEAT